MELLRRKSRASICGKASLIDAIAYPNFKVASLAKSPSISANGMNSFSRREFLQRTISASAAAVAAPAVFGQNGSAPKLNIKVGLDNFSVRALGWKAPALIDYAVSLKT